MSDGKPRDRGPRERVIKLRRVLHRRFAANLLNVAHCDGDDVVWIGGVDRHHRLARAARRITKQQIFVGQRGEARRHLGVLLIEDLSDRGTRNGGCHRRTSSGKTLLQHRSLPAIVRSETAATIPSYYVRQNSRDSRAARRSRKSTSAVSSP